MTITMALATTDREINVYSVDGNDSRRLLHGHREKINSVAFSPRGEWIVTASTDKTICIWDWRKESKLVELRGHSDAVAWVQFSPDSKNVLAVDESGEARLYRCEECCPTRELITLALRRLTDEAALTNP